MSNVQQRATARIMHTPYRRPNFFVRLLLPIARRRAARTVALLVQHKPGWAHKIEPASLDLAHPQDCALGQVYGDYGAGQSTLNIPLFEARHYGVQPAFLSPNWALRIVWGEFAHQRR